MKRIETTFEMPGYPVSETLSLVWAAIAVVLLLFFISYWKIHAFFALLFSSLILGLMSGMSPYSIVASFQKGIADIMGSIAVIIAVGAVMGRLVQITGAGEVIAQRLIRIIGDKRIPWAVFLFAYLIGIPVFFDVAFITFIPLIWNLGRIEKKSLLLYVLPFVAALMTTTGLVPTNPGPAAASQLLAADLGKTMLYGLALGVPMAIVGGIVYGGWISRRMFVEITDSLVAKTQTENQPVSRRPSLLSIVVVILLPVTLMGSAVLLPLVFPSGSKVVVWARFVGHPSIALLSSTAFAYVVLGVRLGVRLPSLMRHTADALNSVGSLILIIGASGAFKQIVLDSGAGSSLVALILHTRISPVLMAYLVAACLRLALGSATGSIATAAGLVAPIAQSFPNVDRVLIVMAVATGGSIFSYVNDAGFWMVKEYCGMTVSQTLKSYSVMKLVTSLTGLLILLVLSRIM